MSWLIIGICAEITPVRRNIYQDFSAEKHTRELRQLLKMFVTGINLSF